jgi:hypothetical protein
LLGLGYALKVPQQFLIIQLQLIETQHLIAAVGYLLVHGPQHLAAELFALGLFEECGFTAHYVSAFSLETDQKH